MCKSGISYLEEYGSEKSYLSIIEKIAPEIEKRKDKKNNSLF